MWVSIPDIPEGVSVVYQKMPFPEPHGRVHKADALRAAFV
jgi:hypothetical protein